MWLSDPNRALGERSGGRVEPAVTALRPGQTAQIARVPSRPEYARGTGKRIVPGTLIRQTNYRTIKLNL